MFQASCDWEYCYAGIDGDSIKELTKSMKEMGWKWCRYDSCLPLKEILSCPTHAKEFERKEMRRP